MKRREINIDHILVICGQGIGNTLLAIPMLTVLRQQFPEIKISVIIWGNGSDAVLRGLSIIDELYVIPADRSRLKMLFIWAKRLRSMKISHCIIAWPPGIFSALLALFSGAAARIGHTLGYCPRVSRLFFTDIVEYVGEIKHDLERNLELAEKIGADIDPVLSGYSEGLPLDLKFADLFLEENQTNKSKLLFGLAPGSGRFQVFKRWPAKHFASLGDQLISDLNGEVVLFIGPDEEDLEQEIVKNMRYSPIVVRNKTIQQVAAIMNKCEVVIANDSGLMHLAVAAAVSVVAIMGPTDPERTRPYGNKNRVARLNFACSPCYNHFRFRFKCKHNPPFECLRALKPSAVLSEVSDILRKEGEKFCLKK